MNETFYMVYIEGGNAPTDKYESKELAEAEAKRLSVELKKKTHILEKVLSVMSVDISETVDSYESACEYLNISQYFSFCLPNSKHWEAIVAIYKLFIIAEAWNKADGFMPDFSDKEQDKYLPWFKYSNDSKLFNYEDMAHVSLTAYLGSRLCFKTKERAEQFGKQFIELWNDFLLIK
jgi:hypothetical protein